MSEQKGKILSVNICGIDGYDPQVLHINQHINIIFGDTLSNYNIIFDFICNNINYENIVERNNTYGFPYVLNKPVIEELKAYIKENVFFGGSLVLEENLSTGVKSYKLYIKDKVIDEVHFNNLQVNVLPVYSAITKPNLERDPIIMWRDFDSSLSIDAIDISVNILDYLERAGFQVIASLSRLESFRILYLKYTDIKDKDIITEFQIRASDKQDVFSPKAIDIGYGMSDSFPENMPILDASITLDEKMLERYHKGI